MAFPYSIGSEQRLPGLDLLRGICAIAILVYHVLLWKYDISLHNIGTYGVYMFFILSGASMTLAYRDKFNAGMKYTTFLCRRYIRLAPLFWILILLHGAALGHNFPKVLLNGSFLFGLASPARSSLLIGGWSLGIEFVFYFLFPAFLFAIEKRVYCWLPFSLIIQFFFVRSVLSDREWDNSWVEYTQFISFIAYFYIGCLIGKVLLSHKAQNSANQYLLWILFAISSTITGMACAYSHYSDIYGLRGLLITFLCAWLVLLSAHLRMGNITALFSEGLGSMSYGIYLLHPIIYGRLNAVATFKECDMITSLCVVSAVTMFASFAINKYWEQPIKRLCYRRLSS